ncbi:hypothetical protein MB46_04775 [Arthrobacter alpinus]|uniref:hypothetical protein n=1 Tax=Arthrobacter alpinus TaxID=656366 RepID=UPI0005C9C418|nr:hypothetical protein [Arthrobacter alpinus]ALV44924.1 hypothetical protein MB46_04775 [Arthrobacter alpinus]
MFTPTPQESAAQAERRTTLEKDPAEHFAGYALMGMPFSSGHYLAFRRFPASSIGPGYHAVWLRTPQGRWSIYADAPWEVSCARYFGAAVAQTHVAGVSGDWSSPWQLMVSVPGVVRWEIDLGTSWVTSLATGMAQRMPVAWWGNDRLLGAMGTMMGPLLSAGRMSMAGVVPNGQSFQAKPLRIWAVTGSRASIDGFDAGTPRPLPEQERMADFWLPQRGLFVSELSLRFPSTAVAPMPGAVQAHGRQS